MTEEMCMDDDGDDRRELSGARRPDDLQSTKEEGWGWGDGFPWTPFGVFNGVAGDCTGRDDRVGHPNQVPGGGGGWVPEAVSSSCSCPYFGAWSGQDAKPSDVFTHGRS